MFFVRICIELTSLLQLPAEIALSVETRGYARVPATNYLVPCMNSDKLTSYRERRCPSHCMLALQSESAFVFWSSRTAAAMPTTLQESIPVLSSDEVISRLRKNGNALNKPFRAMYSSVLNGIITDVSFMLVPIDDHMVHRGHGVFDTAIISNGHLYELDAHLDRLLRSASMAKINPPFSRQELRDILVKTAAVSKAKDGLLRYWLSAGPGGFNLSSHECPTASFYAVVHDLMEESTEPVKVITSSVPMKSPFFATMKSVNYLPNALALLEAEEQGAFAGIWVDEQGFVAEGPNTNVAFVTASGELLMPEVGKILAGFTARRLLSIAEDSLNGLRPPIDNLKAVSVRPILAEEAKRASEMMMIGSGLPVVPVIQWDTQQIGNGQPGPVTLALKALLEEHILADSSSHHERIPYDVYA